MTTATPPKHSLTIDDRGAQHRHRWLPKCSCGHQMIPFRTKVSAEDCYHAHVHAVEREAHRATVGKVKRSTRAGRGRATRTRSPGPKPLTPHDELPPELQ